VTLPQKFVLVGHSAGGTLVTSAAGYLADNGGIADLVGVVLLDGVEPAGSRAVKSALAKLSGANDRPIYLISSQRYFWSRGGDMADKLGAARPDRFNGVSLEGGWHSDYLYGGNPLIQRTQYLITGVSAKRNVAAAADISAAWVNDLFAGTTAEGIYGTAGQRFSIVTPDGTAAAVVLPLGPAQRTPWQRLVDGFFTVIFDWAGRNAFVYEPLDV
jgi:pimeloyl-ACP methyl ester carboxylesterase